MLKHKYAESLNRKLEWDRDHSAEDPRAILQRVVGRYWYPTEAYCSSRVVYAGSPRHWQGKATPSESAGNGRVYASSNHMFGNELDSWKSDFNDMVSSWTKQVNKGAKRAKSTSSSPLSKKDHQETAANAVPVEEEYVIDPITNRKVLKKSYGSFENTPSEEDSARTFKTYRSQFSLFTPPDVEGQPQQDPIHSDGPPPPEELTKYNDVELESDPFASADMFAAQNAALQSEEYSLNHLPPEEAAEILEDVDTYKPVEYDAVESTPMELPSQKYDDLDQYEPTKYDEVQSVKEPGEKYEDLHAYRPSEYDEVPSTQEAEQKYDDLHEYKSYRYNESTALPEDSSPTVYDDLHTYRPYMHNETATTETPTSEYEDLDKYKPTEFPDRARVEDPAPAYKDLNQYDQPFLHQEDKLAPESLQKYDDLDSYKLQDFNDDPSAVEETPFEQYGDLNTYKAYRFQEPDGKPAVDHDNVTVSLNEYDSKAEIRQSLEQSLEDHIAASDAADKEASENVQKSRQKSGQTLQSSMTGSFVRDFPEDFASAWSSSISGLQRQRSTSGKEQELEASVQSAERNFSENLSQATKASVLQTAMDRQQPKGSPTRRQRTPVDTYDPFSTRPQGLETSYVEECGSDSSKMPFVKMYGTCEKPAVNDSTRATGSNTSTSAVSLEELLGDMPTTSNATTRSSTDSPTVYKILAYDPTMQNVSIAETTSVVPDQAAPLTPAEVLVRLSNPTKFFPHFAPLQAQGFEIVSGSGDVLVFRKTRHVEASNKQTAPINPIDMMGASFPSPSAAAFASPTGFVNYDAPQPVEEQRTPPFRSGIDVRREEPVFSGPKTNAQDSGRTRKKRSVTKRVLIGGVWIAGLSYALGVIGEYFATGGIDGTGPRRF